MTDYTTPAPRSLFGSGGDGWSVADADADAVPTAVAPKATATGTGVGAAAGNIVSVYGPSVSIAA